LTPCPSLLASLLLVTELAPALKRGSRKRSRRRVLVTGGAIKIINGQRISKTGRITGWIFMKES